MGLSRQREAPAADTMWARVFTAQDLGRFLARLRVERNLTQSELADALGVSRRYLYEIESGKPSLFTDRLFALLRLLGADLTVQADVGVGGASGFETRPDPGKRSSDDVPPPEAADL